MASRFAKLALVGGAFFWASRAGALGFPETVIPAAAPALDGLPRGGSAAPRLTASKEHDLLREHWADVSDWGRANVDFCAAVMRQESRGRAGAVSSAGAAGLMQVMPATARDIAGRLGYDRYGPDPDRFAPNVSIYLGTAYLEHLDAIDPTAGGSYEWIARAYNGGSKWALHRMQGGTVGAKSDAENAEYWRAIRSRLETY